MGLFDDLFDFDGDGKMGLTDTLTAAALWELFNEVCDEVDASKASEADSDDSED